MEPSHPDPEPDADADGERAARDFQRQQMLAAVKFMGLGAAAPVEEPKASWIERFRSLLFRAHGRSGAARP